jgi:Receptor family ligand binding region
MVKFKSHFIFAPFTLIALCLLPPINLQNITEDDTAANNSTLVLQNTTNTFEIDVNDSITIDYMMDDPSWKYANLSLDDTFYSENYETTGDSFSQTIMNQLRITDEPSALEFRFTNDSLELDRFTNEQFINSSFAKRFKTQNLMKIDDSIHWPIKKEAVMEGHVILGGLMMVHEREDNMTCGPIMPQGGIQALEAMLFTLDKINGMKLLNNITIGAHILDDCDKDTYGLEMAVDFIRGENLSFQLITQFDKFKAFRTIHTIGFSFRSIAWKSLLSKLNIQLNMHLMTVVCG